MTLSFQYVGVLIKTLRQHLAALNKPYIHLHQDWIRDLIKWYVHLISVRSWNFKDGGSLKARFLAKNQHATKEKSLKNAYE